MHPDAGPTRDCRLELVFTARDEPEVTYSWAVESSTLDVITTSPASLTSVTLLRAFLDRVMRYDACAWRRIDWSRTLRYRPALQYTGSQSVPLISPRTQAASVSHSASDLDRHRRTPLCA